MHDRFFKSERPVSRVHTLHEQRDINDATALFENATAIKTDTEMVTLARQLIDRQTTTYDPADIKDRYETRLRGMIDAKLKGVGIEEEESAEPNQGNVVDLMTALKKSLGQKSKPPAGASRAPKDKAEPVIKVPKKRAAALPSSKPARKRA